jgi:hypothetical protein
MKCKNVEPLLSLYVGSDLEEEESRSVAAHLQSCTDCTLAADQYFAASQLLQRYEPPLFGDQTYAGIRGQVLNEIERESRARAWPGIFSQLFLPLVQPRMRWITAALLLGISVTALYLSRNRSHQLPNDQQVAVRSRDESAGPSSVSNKGQDNMGVQRRPITRKKKAKADSSSSDRVVQRNVILSQPSSAPAPLRVELQTSNRNIRIIWLSSQRTSAAGTDGSKGI